MKSSGNLTIRHKCSGCELRRRGFFCDLPSGTLQALEALKITMSYPKGTALFLEGEPASGVYIICQGRIKLSTHSSDGKALILRVAEPGEVLALSAVVAGTELKATAEVLESCQVNFIRKQDLLRFIRNHADAGLAALRQLSDNYHQAYTQVCSLGLSSSVADKLAKLLLGWCRRASPLPPLAGMAGVNGSSIRMKLTFSHEEIAEMIGTSRETVTRLLKEFRERGLISLKGSDLVIHSERGLESSIGSPRGRGRAAL
ncbi:MAG: Crp/Fnr family transcriptional regulator [Pyrinomonadaceae bacterium]